MWDREELDGLGTSTTVSGAKGILLCTSHRNVTNASIQLEGGGGVD